MELTGGAKAGLVNWIGGQICNVLCIFPEFFEYPTEVGLAMALRCVEALVDGTHIPMPYQGLLRGDVLVAIEGVMA